LLKKGERLINHKELLISIIGAFIAVAMAGFFTNVILSSTDSPLIIASAGASAMLMFGLPHSDVSHPYNLIAGHTVSAVVGVSCYYLVSDPIISSSLAISLALLIMSLLKCMHPPGGATAVIAVVGGEAIHQLGYMFVVMPIFLNSLMLLVVAIAVASFRDKNPFENYL
jgi:CBS domain-containing membrane protein